VQEPQPSGVTPRRQAALGAGALALALALALACAPSPPSAAAPAPTAAAAPAAPAAAPARAPVDVTVGVVVHSSTQLPWYVGDKAGLFAEEGINLTITQLPTQASIAAMIEGSVGYSTSGASVIRAAASGRPVKLIAGGRNAPDWQLMVQPGLGSVADLRGKRIGVLEPTGAATLVTFELLAKHGVARQDVDAINLLSTQGVLAGLLAQQVDGGLVAPPNTVQARREGLNTLVYSADAVQVLQGGLGTSDQRLRERATEVDAMLRALLRATRAMQSVPELVTRVLVERFDLAPEVAAEMVDETALGFTPDASASDEVIQREIAAQEEAIGQKLNATVADVADFGPLHRAQAAVGITAGR
jgi:NitT/TauT family transport system substrate-binding protein